jgi:hypothetical protein
LTPLPKTQGGNTKKCIKANSPEKSSPVNPAATIAKKDLFYEEAQNKK